MIAVFENDLYDAPYPPDAGKGRRAIMSRDFGSTWNVISGIIFAAYYDTIGFWTSVAISANGLIIIGCFAQRVFFSIDSGYSWFTPNVGIPNNPTFTAVACNADGSILMFAVGTRGDVYRLDGHTVTTSGGIYISYDFGITWNLSSNTSDGTIITNSNWICLKSNTSGSILIAIDIDGNIYLSTNRGLIWTNVTNQYYKWTSVVSNFDGTKNFATIEDGGIFYYNVSNASINSSWQMFTNNTIIQNQKWISIDCDNSGNNVIVCAQYGNGIFVSNNSGTNWSLVTQTNLQNNYWTSVAIGANGTTIYVSGLFGAGIWSSNVQGNNWTQGSNTQYQNWNFIKKNSFGTTFFSGTDNGSLWNLSNNTWSPNLNFNGMTNGIQSQYWISCASNYNGSDLQSVIYGGSNFLSSNNGNNWNINTAPGNGNYTWKYITNDKSGTDLVYLAVIDNLGVFMYSNYTWNNIYSNNISWNSVCSTSNVKTVYATAYNSGVWKGVYTSSWTWAQTSAPAAAWSSITCDVSGVRVVATTDTNSTYTSYDSGNTWIDVTTFNASAASTSGSDYLYYSLRRWYLVFE
jgi:hypothetical protein